MAEVRMTKSEAARILGVDTRANIADVTKA